MKKIVTTLLVCVLLAVFGLTALAADEGDVEGFSIEALPAFGENEEPVLVPAAPTAEASPAPTEAPESAAPEGKTPEQGEADIPVSSPPEGDSANNQETAEKTTVPVWITAAVLSVLALAAVVIIRKRKAASK